MRCPQCGGLGSTERSQQIGSGDWARWVAVRQSCPSCNGSREVADPPHHEVVVDTRTPWQMAEEQIEKGHRR